MQLEGFCFGDPRLVLIPVEHMGPTGMSDDFAFELRARGWSTARVELFDTAFSLYWRRADELSARTSTWAPPRLRNVAILAAGESIPPYVQLLNESAWTLYDADFDPETSHAELGAYLFAHGERMSLTGEATLAALRNAAYWFDRDADEVAAFQAAARRSRRPDAAAFAALAAALEWLPRLAHEELRPPADPRRHRSIPGTGLLVPAALAAEPPRLAATWTAVAQSLLREYRAAWRRTDPAAVRAIGDWLASAAPPLLVTGKGNRVLWDPEHPERLGALRAELRRGGAQPLADVHRDLQVVAARTQAFFACVDDANVLPAPDDSLAQNGYAYLFRGRKLLAYNLHEPNLYRLEVPALPFARHMLGARALHEWAHLAVEAGWTRPVVSEEELQARLADWARCFDEVIAAAPPAVRSHTRADLEALCREHPADNPDSVLPNASTPGAALVHMILPRLDDYKANLLATRLQSMEERETYVRQNIRSLRAEYRSTALWRMLARYVYEYQYLRFSLIPHPREVFLRGTWFAADFLRGGVLDEMQFDRLAAACARLCAAYDLDADRFRFA